MKETWNDKNCVHFAARKLSVYVMKMKGLVPVHRALHGLKHNSERASTSAPIPVFIFSSFLIGFFFLSVPCDSVHLLIIYL